LKISSQDERAGLKKHLISAYNEYMRTIVHTASFGGKQTRVIELSGLLVEETNWR
jgi:hypothetical protein